jgi:hypothetical protein
MFGCFLKLNPIFILQGGLLMKIRSCIISIIGIAAILMCVMLIQNKQVDAEEYNNANKMASKLNVAIHNMMEEIISKSNKDFRILAGGPYKLTEDNKYFDEIVETGYPALPLLEDYISKSEQNGITEYLLAIAMETILKTNLREEYAQWGSSTEKGLGLNQDDYLQWENETDKDLVGTSKGFINTYEVHLESVPSKVEKILKSQESKKDKVKNLKKLGIVSLPFILEYNDTESEVVIQCLHYFIPNSNISLSNEEGNKIDTWSQANKKNLKEFKQYVENKKSKKVKKTY